MNINADTPDERSTQPTDEELIASARYRELAASARDIIYGIDRNGHVSFHNSAATRVLDFGTNSLVGRHYLDLVAAPDRERVHRFYLRQFARKIPNTYLEFLAYTPDGSDLWLGQNVQLVLDDEHLGFYAVARDISDRRRMELALRESEERFRRSFDDAPIGMALVALDGRFTRVNTVLCELLGRTEAELLALNFQAITHPDDLDLDLRHVRKLIVGEIASYQLEKRYLHRDGRSIWIQLSVSLVRDEHQRPQYFIAQIQSVDERRAMLEELARARDAALESSRMKSAFLASMSHEIRTPMNGIIGVAGLMLGTTLTAEQREYMTMIRSSAESLFGLLNNVVDVARLEAGRLELVSSDVAIRAIVDDVVDTFRPHSLERGLRLASVVGDSVPERIEGDEVRLRQVLENLVGNALKFTDDGDVIVSVVPSRDAYGRAEVRFEIADTGIGMAAEDIPRLFDPFTQADESSTRAHGGAGLGLAICQRLVQLMGGAIGVEPREPQGSVVWFTIPTGAAASGSATLIAERGAELAQREAVRTLVVEDNPINRMVTLGQLRQSGIGADIATDGWEALDALSRADYDLILMDCDMPALDGCAATELIRRFESPDEHIVIVAVTAQSDERARERCLAAGMDEYLGKPVSSEQLAAVVDRVASMRRAGLRARDVGALEPTLDLRALDRLGLFDEARRHALDAQIASFTTAMRIGLQSIDEALRNRDVDGVGRATCELSADARSMGALRLAWLLEQLGAWLPERRIEGAHFIALQARRALDAAASALMRATTGV